MRMCSTYFVEYKDFQKESILNGIRDTAISGADYVSKLNKLNTKNLNEFKANLIKTDSIGISSLGLWGIYLGLYRIPRIYDKFNTRAWSNFLKNFDRFKIDNTYYYKDCAIALGLTKIGEDYYFFNAGSGKLYKDKNLWVGTNNYGIVGGMHYFDADGKMAQ